MLHNTEAQPPPTLLTWSDFFPPQVSPTLTDNSQHIWLNLAVNKSLKLRFAGCQFLFQIPDYIVLE